MRFSRYFLLLTLGVSLAGCEANNLYVAHETVIGVSASLSQDRQQGQLVIGYDRDFITIIPKAVKYLPVDKNGKPIPKVGGMAVYEACKADTNSETCKEAVANSDRRDVMALLNCTSVKVDGLFLSEYSDSLASGEAANLFATKLGANPGQATGSHFFDCGAIGETQDAKAKQTGDNQE